jgi:hypothetical protein
MLSVECSMFPAAWRAALYASPPRGAQRFTRARRVAAPPLYASPPRGGSAALRGYLQSPSPQTPDPYNASSGQRFQPVSKHFPVGGASYTSPHLKTTNYICRKRAQRTQSPAPECEQEPAEETENEFPPPTVGQRFQPVSKHFPVGGASYTSPHLNHG